MWGVLAKGKLVGMVGGEPPHVERGQGHGHVPQVPLPVLLVTFVLSKGQEKVTKRVQIV